MTARYHGVEIVYTDNHLLIAVKPPNMPSQADASGDMDIHSLLKAYIKETCGKPGAVYLGLVHRLDRPVGGLMAFARTSKAAARLSEQLRTHTMRRGYLAVARGISAPEARLEDLLERNDGEPQRAALTYRCAAQAQGLSLLRVSLETGRKHQIRTQLARAGLPIWGDARYGNGRPGEQIALWGAALQLIHPTKKIPLSFQSKPATPEPWRIFPQEAIDSAIDG